MRAPATFLLYVAELNYFSLFIGFLNFFFFCHYVVFSDFCASEKELKFPFRETRNVGRCPSSLTLKTKKELPASMVLDLCLFSECQTARQVYLNTFLVLLVNIELSVFLSGCHLISGRKGVN